MSVFSMYIWLEFRINFCIFNTHIGLFKDNNSFGAINHFIAFLKGKVLTLCPKRI